MRLSASDYLITGGILSVIVTFSLLFYYDLTKKVDIGESEVVGAITFKRKTAQRKYSRQVVWEDVQQEMPVYNNDSIRTADLSEAVIKLKDGTEISLDENSMILIALSGNEVGIDFTQGSIKANRDNVKDGALKTLQITSKGTTVSIDKSDVSLTQESGKELSLTVNKGDATIDAGGEKQTVKEDQKIIASKDEIKVFELKIKLIKPESRQFITFKQKANPVAFSWEEIEGPYAVSLDISEDNLFEKGTMKQQVRGTSFSRYLPEGNYDWRVTAVNRNNQKMELSEIRRFSVIRDDDIQLISPENNSVIQYRNELPIIQFKWNESDMVSGYRMLVSSDKDMKSIISTTDITAPPLSVFDLGQGNYYWKIQKVSAISGLNLSGESPVYKLNINKKDQVEPPHLISPAENKRISQIVVQNKNIVFSWRNNREIQKSRLTISRDQEFKNIIQSSETENNFINFKGNIPLGKYYWKVDGFLDDGGKTEPSETWPFEIIKSEEIVLVKPEEKELLLPEEDSSTADISFSWKKIDIQGSFTLEIARNSTFSDIYKKRDTDDFYFLEKGMKSGQYYWRIVLKDEDGNDLVKSGVRSFNVLDNLTEPVALSPREGTVIDMVDKNSLDFSWKQIRGANHYRMSLYQDRGGVLQWITNVETGGTQCSIADLNKLDVGSFHWTLQAFDREKGTNRVIRKSTIIKNNFKIKLGKNDKELKIKVPDVIYIK